MKSRLNHIALVAADPQRSAGIFELMLGAEVVLAGTRPGEIEAEASTSWTTTTICSNCASPTLQTKAMADSVFDRLR